MLSKERFDQWIEALESGDYSKGMFYLKRGYEGEMSYCCLGVLGELFGKLDKSVSKDGNLEFYYGGDKERTGFLPYFIIDEETQNFVSMVNDDHETWAPVIEAIKKKEDKIVRKV